VDELTAPYIDLSSNMGEVFTSMVVYNIRGHRSDTEEHFTWA
jgi:hypothetical protein